MTGLKLAVLGALAGVASSIVGDTASKIAVLAAGAAGAGYLFKHVLLPLALFIRKAMIGYAVLEQLTEKDVMQALKALPDWMVGVDHHLRSLDAAVVASKEQAEAIARELHVQHREAPGPPPV